MGLHYPQPIFSSSIYNPDYFLKLDSSGYLTYEYAQTLYLDKNDYRLTFLSGITPGTATSGSAIVLDETLSLSGLDSISCSALTVGGVAVGTLPSFLDGITPGMAANNKALVLDGSGSIATISSLTATNIFGSIKTAAQPSITSLGTLTGLVINAANSTTNGSLMSDYALCLINPSNTNNNQVGLCFGISGNAPNAYAGGASIVHKRVDTNSAGGLIFSVRNSPVAANPLIEAFKIEANGSTSFSYQMTIDNNLTFTGASRTITGLSSITATTLNGAVSGSQPGITAVGLLNGLNIDDNLVFSGIDRVISGLSSLGATNLNATTYKQGGVVYDLSLVNRLSLTTLGTAEASKALVLDSTSSARGVASLEINQTATLSTSSTMDAFGLILRRNSGSTGDTCGISLGVTNVSSPSLSTGGASILFTRSSAGQGIGTLSFNIRTSTATALTPLSEVLRFNTDGSAAFAYSLAAPSITTDTITKAGTLSMTPTTLNLNPTTLQIRGTTMSATATELNALSGLTASSTDLNYSDITTLGTFQSGKVMTLAATSGIGLMPLGSAGTNCRRFFGGTAYKETIDIYRDSDSSGLTIASKTSATSINKTYPLLKLVSTIDPSNLGTGSGIAATTDDLFRIDWNDKPGGFTSQTHRLCFDIGSTRPYYSGSGFPHTFGLTTSANCFAINVAGTTANPTSDCLYIISDTINKMIYNTNTPYTNATYGTSNITFNDSTLYIKSSHDLNDGTVNYDMPLFIVSSNASPIEVGIQIHNGAKSTASNAAIIGTTTSNDFGIMTGNSRRMTIKSGGYIGIGTTNPAAPLQITSTAPYTWNSFNNVGITVYRLRTDSGNTETAGGVAVPYTNVAALFGGYIGCEAMVMQSDRRLKQDIADVPIGRVECLYKSLRVKSYKWKAHPDKPKELGLIAQDVLDQGFVDLVAKAPDNDPELEQSNAPWLEPKGVKLSVDYPKLSAYNMRMIQELMERIEELETKLATLT
jgi:hypothetical protein